MENTKVLIVGAGPTGLVLALSLARRGIPLRIVDKKAGPGEASRAMAVQARTLELYDQFGLASDVVAQGVQIETLHMRENGKDQALVHLADMGKGISPYPFALSYPQDDHERFLVERLTDLGVTIDWNSELESFSQGDERVMAALRSEKGGETIEAAYICGCDGARSKVREGLSAHFAGGTYKQLFFVADVKLEGDWGADGYINFSSTGFLLILPVRSSHMHRLIGLVPNELTTKTEIAFEDVRAISEEFAGRRIESVNWFSTYHSHHRVADRFRHGRAFIAGDAGHIHSPAGGQGMNTGIGDAINLGWKLASVIQDRAAQAILDTYEQERLPFARTLVASTDRVFESVVAEGLRGRFVRTWLLPHLFPLVSHFRSGRRAVFDVISQIRIEYRDSALSAGKAGSVAGGDRLPWVASHGHDNFALLRSLDWQMHVYGQAAASLVEASARLKLPLHVIPWSDEAERQGLKRDAAYLIRPDGYVALAMPRQETQLLDDYAVRFSLTFEFSGRAHETAH